MASRVDIANLALTKLGSASKITALTDNSPAARAMNGVYDITRKALLRRYHWAFALTRTTLPALADAPAWGFARACALPADFLRMVQVNDVVAVPALNDYTDGDTSPWAIETLTLAGGGTALAILTDFDVPLKIRYVRDVTDEGTFDALFVMALAARLAYETCEQITQSNSKKQAAAEDLKQALRDAVMTGAIEKPPSTIADDSWIVSRI
jgi:hypothetical protein